MKYKNSYLRSVLAIFLMANLTGCFLFSSTSSTSIIEYKIKRGDTLYGISQAYGSTVSEIQSLNRIRDPRRLQVGSIVLVPARYSGKTPRQSNSILTARPTDKDSVQILAQSPARRFIGRLYWPAPQAEFSSGFGRRWVSFHQGLDLRAPKGTPIYAAHDGIVIYSDNGFGGYGNMILLRAPDLITAYAHNTRNFVRVGDYVKRGQRIAEVGNTGRATGPHLHFETRIRGPENDNVAIDPLAFFPGRG